MTAVARLLVGMTLLCTNQIVGWGGMILFGNIARKTGKKFYYFAGLAVYGFSWLMLLAGVWLVGVSQALAVMRYLPDWLTALIILAGAAGYFLWLRAARRRRPSEAA